MSSVTQAYGANIAFIEELYERYRSNPDSVSASWREFFHDYQPQFEEDLAEDLEEERAVAAQPHATPPTAAAPTPAPAVAPAPAPAPAAPAPPTPVPTNQKIVVLRGAAGKIAQN